MENTYINNKRTTVMNFGFLGGKIAVYLLIFLLVSFIIMLCLNDSKNQLGTLNIYLNQNNLSKENQNVDDRIL